MSLSIKVRELQEKDYPDLLIIENSIWTNENSPVLHHYDNIEEYKKRTENNLVFVAVTNEQVVGFIDVHPPTTLPSHRHQWVLGIGVHPDFQSFGVGRHLLDHVKAIAPSHGIHKISLRVMGGNTGAIDFYKRNGFIQEGHLKDEFFINGTYSDDFLFAYLLP